MSLRDLLILYGIVGVACAIAVFRRERHRGVRVAMASAMATVALWPLWAPFVLATPRPRTRPTTNSAPAREAAPGAAPGEPVRGDCHGALPRIEHALDESVKAVAGTPMNQVFSKQIAQRIAAEVERVAGRVQELTLLADSCGLDRAASQARVRDLEAQGASERTLATARLQHESFVRLDELRAADCAALDELADLLEALRAQLLVARYAGSSADGTGAIVSEVWARLEGLGVAFDVAAPEVAT